jgi:ubiquitin C-terminal hydrolase
LHLHDEGRKEVVVVVVVVVVVSAVMYTSTVHWCFKIFKTVLLVLLLIAFIMRVRLLHRYVETEKLEGENQYDAVEHGKQDAEKGVSFVSFPPVLNLQLKRFDFDMYTGDMVKVSEFGRAAMFGLVLCERRR